MTNRPCIYLCKTLFYIIGYLQYEVWNKRSIKTSQDSLRKAMASSIIFAFHWTATCNSYKRLRPLAFDFTTKSYRKLMPDVEAGNLFSGCFHQISDADAKIRKADRWKKLHDSGDSGCGHPNPTRQFRRQKQEIRGTRKANIDFTDPYSPSVLDLLLGPPPLLPPTSGGRVRFEVYEWI